jgi:hypothetical protein
VSESVKFPALRFRLALLLSFFPCALLYPMGYPTREVITLGAWIAVFPSGLACSSVLLLPLFVSSYGYYAFNLFSVLAVVGVGFKAWAHKDDSLGWQDVFRYSRFCVYLTLGIALWQVVMPGLWMTLFPDLQGLGGGRGAGLRTEPSLLAAPFALYLSLLVIQMLSGSASHRRAYLVEALLTISALVAITRSLSVFIAVLCFAPALISRIRYFLTVGVAAIGIGAVVFADRLVEGFAIANGSMIYLLTLAVGSWRNVPDILILSNFGEYLLPGNPAQVREHLNALAVGWIPGFEWLDNTYSTFSAAATSLGLVVTLCLFVGGALIGLRQLRTIPGVRSTWILLYLACWFFFPKFEATGWLAVAVLFALPHRTEETERTSKLRWYVRLARLACTPKIRTVDPVGPELQH